MEHCLVVVVASASDPSWMYLVISFLADRSLLTDIKEVEKVWRTSSRFWLSEDKKLYQQSFRGLYCCVFNLMTFLVSLLSCMKGFMVVILGEDHYLTE